MCRVLAGLMLAAGATHAEPNRDIIDRPLVLDPGQLAATLTLEVSLGPYVIGEPFSLAPDMWYGVAPRWTIGLVHSSTDLDLIDATGRSLCLGQTPEACPQLYRGSGIDVRYGWREGPLAVAPRGRFVVRDVDPIKPAVLVGALVRWTRGRFMIHSDPYLRIGLANRGRGNRDALVVPIWLGVQPTCRWLVALHTGWDGELATWRDGWHVPIGLAITARATTSIDVGVEGGFSQAIGPQNYARLRSMFVFVGYRR